MNYPAATFIHPASLADHLRAMMEDHTSAHGKEPLYGYVVMGDGTLFDKRAYQRLVSVTQDKGRFYITFSTPDTGEERRELGQHGMSVAAFIPSNVTLTLPGCSFHPRGVAAVLLHPKSPHVLEVHLSSGASLQFTLHKSSTDTGRIHYWEAVGFVHAHVRHSVLASRGL